MSELYLLWCASCRANREFEQPPCGDGHGHECPELACTFCGEAVLGTATIPAVDIPRRTSRRGRTRRTNVA